GALISWRSSKQRSVATSSCEAEYIALTEAVKESKFLRQLLSDMTGCEKESVLLYCDNQSAMKLAKNPVFHDRSKHIDIKYHFIREAVIDDAIVVLKYIPTAKNVADIFTKPLSKVKFKEFEMIKGTKAG
ncbi:unnamed protein product, partial [Meganyctiphanes norvegica]